MPPQDFSLREPILLQFHLLHVFKLPNETPLKEEMFQCPVRFHPRNPKGDPLGPSTAHIRHPVPLSEWEWILTWVQCNSEHPLRTLLLCQPLHQQEASDNAETELCITITEELVKSKAGGGVTGTSQEINWMPGLAPKNLFLLHQSTTYKPSTRSRVHTEQSTHEV